jgi:hypothetical protein
VARFVNSAESAGVVVGSDRALAEVHESAAFGQLPELPEAPMLAQHEDYLWEQRHQKDLHRYGIRYYLVEAKLQHHRKNPSKYPRRRVQRSSYLRQASLAGPPAFAVELAGRLVPLPDWMVPLAEWEQLFHSMHSGASEHEFFGMGHQFAHLFRVDTKSSQRQKNELDHPKTNHAIRISKEKSDTYSWCGFAL